MPKSAANGHFKLKLILKREPKLKYTKLLSARTKQGRSTIHITQTKQSIIIEINAHDATALRASTNSLLRDLQVIESTRI
jgi:Transcription factor Pcc1